MSITKNKNTAIINFKDTVNLDDIVNGSNNNHFFQGNTAFSLELTAQKGAEVQVNLDDSKTRAIVYSEKYSMIIGESPIKSIASGVITIEGDEVLTHKDGLNYLYIQEENDDGDFETTYALSYIVDFNPLYKATIKPATDVEEYIKSVNGVKPDINGNIKIKAVDILDKNDNNLQSTLDDLESEDERQDGIQISQGQSIAANKKLIDNLKNNKLDVDLGNVDKDGLIEKLTDADVAFKSQIPKPAPAPSVKPITVGSQEIHESDSHDLTLPYDINKINLQINTEGQPFEVKLPESKAGTLIYLGGVEHPDVQSRGQVVVKMTDGSTWQIQGGSEYIMENVKETYILLISTGSEYLVTPMYDLFEEAGSGDITFNDMVGGSLTSNNFNFDRTLTVHQDKSLYEDEQSDIAVESTSTMELTSKNTIGIAPDLLNDIYGNDGFYASLSTPIEVLVGRKGKLWFDNVIVPTKGFIQINRDEKSYGLQDALNDDPNISGGEPILVDVNISLIGTAPENGSVTLSLIDTKTNQPVLSSKGKPLTISKSYTGGDLLGNLEIKTLLVEKGVEEIAVEISHSFQSDMIVLKDLDSTIMIQLIKADHQTGEALLASRSNIKFLKRYVGKDFFNLGFYLEKDIPITDIKAGEGMTDIDGVHFYNPTGLKIGVENSILKISDNGKDIPYFNFGKIFTEEDTELLSNGDISSDTVTKTQDDAYRVLMVGYTGDNLDIQNAKIIVGISNMQPQYEKDWELINDSDFIGEDIKDEFVGKTSVMAVPDKYKNIAVILVPVSSQIPLNLELKSFKISSSKNSYVWEIK